MYILGISSYYHDSAAALIKDGKIIAASQEERFSRKKNDSSFPRNSILYCLSIENIDLSSVDIIVFYDKPFLKFERILETFYRGAPLGFKPFFKGIPIWIKEKMFFKRMLRKELKNIGNYNSSATKLLFTEHHLSHSASAFFASPFDRAAILTIDGVGEWTTLSISYGEGNSIKVLKEMHFPDSIGLFYSSFTYYLGFTVNEGEYKLMGLAPYGDRTSKLTQQYVETIRKNLIDIYEDGSISMDQTFFNYQNGMTMVNEKRWKDLFGFSKRKSDEDLSCQHCSLACAAQIITEEILIKLVTEAKKATNAETLCLAGGVALNCVANGKIVKKEIFKDVFIQPAAGDAGGALGAALAAYYIYMGNPRDLPDNDIMQGALLGPSFSDNEILEFAQKTTIPFFKIEKTKDLCEFTAQKILEGNCIGWFQGRMEFGPRALGNRSILADPRSPEMQRRVNLKIKFRENFRPFAPVILEEETPLYFEDSEYSPYMLLTSFIRSDYRLSLPENYSSLSVNDKLSIVKSSFPAITHVDFSSRLQTVDKKTNPLFRNLIFAFKQLTGCPMLINTSFNVRGEPIVCTPEDAFQCFIKTEMDYLVLGNIIFDKNKCKN